MSKRKMFITAVLLIAGVSCASTKLYSTLDAADITDGTNVLDLAGSAENGVISGTWIENTGQVGECMYTGNRTGYVNYGDVWDAGSGSQTVMLWARWGGSGGVRVAASHGNIGSANGGWTIIEASGQLIMRTADIDGNRAGTSSAAGAIPSGSWVHIALVIDRDANKVIGYVNGSNTGFTPGGWGPSTDSLAALGFIDSTQPLMLGADSSGGSYGYGGLDEFAVFDRALSAGEINAIYKHGVAGFGVTLDPEVLAGYLMGSRSAVGSDDQISGSDFTESISAPGTVLIDKSNSVDPTPDGTQPFYELSLKTGTVSFAVAPDNGVQMSLTNLSFAMQIVTEDRWVKLTSSATGDTVLWDAQGSDTLGYQGSTNLIGHEFLSFDVDLSGIPSLQGVDSEVVFTFEYDTNPASTLSPINRIWRLDNVLIEGVKVGPIGDIVYDVEGTNMILGWTGFSGDTYAVQQTPDLVEGNWSNVVDGIPGVNGDMWSTNAMSSPQMFYRIVK